MRPLMGVAVLLIEQFTTLAPTLGSLRERCGRCGAGAAGPIRDSALELPRMRKRTVAQRHARDAFIAVTSSEVTRRLT